MNISCVIVSWNTRDTLRDCLQSIHEQTQQIRFEVIVIDNASSDGSVEMVETEFPDVILIKNTENRGFAAANNQGIKIARGHYVLLLNSDTIVLDHAIEKSCAFADHHQDAAVMGCRILNSDRTLQPGCFMTPSLLNMVLSVFYLNKLFPKQRFFGRERMTWWDYNHAREVEVIVGAFMLVRRQALDQVGLMDEDYFMYAEETDWCYRFRRAGWKVMYTPEAEIIHLGGRSSQQVQVTSLLRLRLAILQFFYKNKNRFTFFCAAILTCLFFVFRIPIWMIAFLLKPADASRRDRIKAYCTGVKKIVYVIIHPSLEKFRI